MFTLEDDGWKLVVNGIESGQFTIPGMWNTVNAIYDRRLGAPMYLVFINGTHRRFFVGNRDEWDMFIPSPQALLNWVSR